MPSKNEFILLGLIALFFAMMFGSLYFGYKYDKAEAVSKCGNKQQDFVRIQGRLLCVDPKTRVVYFPG